MIIALLFKEALCIHRQKQSPLNHGTWKALACTWYYHLVILMATKNAAYRPYFSCAECNANAEQNPLFELRILRKMLTRNSPKFTTISILVNRYFQYFLTLLNLPSDLSNLNELTILSQIIFNNCLIIDTTFRRSSLYLSTKNPAT